MKGVFMDKFHYSKKKGRNSLRIAYITAVCRWPAAPSILKYLTVL